MAFCVEYLEKHRWKVMKNTIRPSKEEAEKEKLSILSCCIEDEELKHIPAKDRYRIKRLRSKEVKALLGDKYEACVFS